MVLQRFQGEPQGFLRGHNPHVEVTGAHEETKAGAQTRGHHPQRGLFQMPRVHIQESPGHITGPGLEDLAQTINPGDSCKSRGRNSLPQPGEIGTFHTIPQCSGMGVEQGSIRDKRPEDRANPFLVVAGSAGGFTVDAQVGAQADDFSQDGPRVIEAQPVARPGFPFGLKRDPRVENRVEKPCFGPPEGFE